MTLQYELLLVASRFETALLFSLDVSQGVKKHHRNQLPLKCRHCDWNLKACPAGECRPTDTFFMARIPARAYRSEPSVAECLWCA